jgi:CubicO group peptidase (beta-lactamase class C family)
MKNRPLIAFVLLVTGGFAQADPALQSFLEKSLADARSAAGLPAVAALVQIDGRIEAQAATGVRVEGRRESVTLDDSWHLGSDTKAMTATLIARLVEQGFLRFEDTMAQIFPGVAARMSPEFHATTVAQLLSHTSGLPALSSEQQMTTYLQVIKGETGLRAQRAAIVDHYLGRKPVSKPGEFSYSNIGYAIAGAVAEERTGESWEELMRREVWKPLGIRSGGFGPPKAGRHGQPWGHGRSNDRWVPQDPGSPDSDNPPSIGPAGTIHMSLRDWLLFVQDQLEGERGRGKLLKAESYRRLHAPVTKNYAMGWGVLRDADGATSLLMHTGSNGYWIADVRIAPKRNVIVLITMNAGGAMAEKADKDLGKALLDHLKALD